MARFVERLTVPWWMWPVALALATLLAAELHMGAPGLRSWLPYTVVVPGVLVSLWWLGRIRIVVADGELRVDDSRLPVRFIADAVPLDAEGRREILGPAAHPLAFVVQRPWAPSAVQVLLDDPADPTPYWVVSTRQPDRLVAALLEERGRVSPPDAPDAEVSAPDAPGAGVSAPEATPAAERSAPFGSPNPGASSPAG